MQRLEMEDLPRRQRTLRARLGPWNRLMLTAGLAPAAAGRRRPGHARCRAARLPGVCPGVPPGAKGRPAGEDGGPVTWAEVTRVFGKTMHPLAQYHRLIGPEVRERQEILDSSGWRYSEPDQGNLAAHILGPVATILCRHTTTPDSGVAAVWEGWGGLARLSRLPAAGPQSGAGFRGSLGSSRRRTAPGPACCPQRR